MRSIMVQVFFIILCLFTCKIVCAQDYIVTLQNDTLPGKVSVLNYGIQQKVQLTPDVGKKKTYDILQVKSFYSDSEIYHTVRIAPGYAFMKLQRGGYLSLYAFQPQGQVNWDSRYLMKRDGSGMEVPNLGFKKRISQFLEDCPIVTEKIEAGEYSRNDLDEIITVYNACIVNKTEKHEKEIQQTVIKTEKLHYWNELDTSLEAKGAFEEKTNALEMIKEIKLKIQRSEKIPNFLIDGLKNSLKDHADLTIILEKALVELN